MPRYYVKNGRLSLEDRDGESKVPLQPTPAQPVIAHMKEWQPDLTVSDYEPLMWQVSRTWPSTARNSSSQAPCQRDSLFQVKGGDCSEVLTHR